MFDINRELHSRGILNIDQLNSVFPELAGRPALQLAAVDYALDRGLDWRAGHVVPRLSEVNGIVTVEHIVTLEGYRMIAHNSGNYLGTDEPIFGPVKTFSGLPGTSSIEAPEFCTVTVHFLAANGSERRYTATEYFSENYSTDSMGLITTFYRKRPHGQLRVRAEAQALRGAFAQCDSHTVEELPLMEEIDRLAGRDNKNTLKADSIVDDFVQRYQTAQTADEYALVSNQWDVAVRKPGAQVTSEEFGRVQAAAAEARAQFSN